MFGRRRRHDEEPVREPVDEVNEADAGATGPGEDLRGPWDVEDAPEDEVPRLDLGALRVPTLPGVEVRVDATPAGEVVAVTMVDGRNALQVGAFAAPRSEGIWTEVRAEIGDSLHEQGGSAHEQFGPFGPELVARVPGAEGQQDARFVGVDGPRWFLRGVFTGPAALDEQQAALLERSLRGVVVVRGGEAMPVRDPLPLAIPREVLEERAAQLGGTQLPPPERGPEITETR